MATIISTDTKNTFKLRIFLLMSVPIFSLILIKLTTSNVWAIISNIIKPKSTNFLKNLYKSFSKLIPKKIECEIKNIAEPTPNIKKYLFLLVSLLITWINLLFDIQYWINKIAVIIIPGLNKR